MAVSESIKAKVIEAINDEKNLEIKKMEGVSKVYIYAVTNGLRVDARNSLTAALKKQKIATEEKLSKKSTSRRHKYKSPGRSPRRNIKKQN